MNLNNYEDVQARITRWYGNHPNARISTRLEHIYTDDGGALVSVVVSASVYRDAEDANPAGTGLAQEHRTERGVNVAFALENCETSAIGRAIVNAGLAPSTGTRPSRQEMEKAAQVAPQTAGVATVHAPGPEGVAAKTPPAAAPSPSMGEAVGNVLDAMPGARIESQGPSAPVKVRNGDAEATDKQKGMIRKLIKETGLDGDQATARQFVTWAVGAPVAFDDLNRGQASQLIDALKSEADRQADSAVQAVKHDDPWANETPGGEW